jgi:hypothetical protein
MQLVCDTISSAMLLEQSHELSMHCTQFLQMLCDELDHFLLVNVLLPEPLPQTQYYVINIG